MIRQDGQATRVERVESRMWVESGVGAGIAVILAGYFATRPVQPFGLVVAAVLVLLGLGLLVTGIRRRAVCVIELSRVGWGDVDGRMWWFERDRVASARVVRLPVTAVSLFDGRDKLVAHRILSFFDPEELRQAFTEAGITVR